jgi:hypothetical protein
MLHNAHDQNFSCSLTSRMLQSSPLKKSRPEIMMPKKLGLSNGKGNVSNTLTCKKFIKQQGLVQRLHPRSI